MGGGRHRNTTGSLASRVDRVKGAPSSAIVCAGAHSLREFSSCHAASDLPRAPRLADAFGVHDESGEDSPTLSTSARDP
jgi:hypothetical protein